MSIINLIINFFNRLFGRKHTPKKRWYNNISVPYLASKKEYTPNVASHTARKLPRAVRPI